MPSSLIIVALAAAWLIVLVPMVARKRQEVVHTADDALASRVVRRGSARGDEREEHVMSESAAQGDRVDDVQRDESVMPDETDAVEAEAYDVAGDDLAHDGERDQGYEAEYEDGYEPDYEPDYEEPVRPSPRARRTGGYRPGRGGFDPEAAEIAARAKYAFRQRVVLALLATVVISAVIAGVVLPVLWWLTGAAGVTLVTYLAYLRRQVRIETEIRQRRLNRLNGEGAVRRESRELDHDAADYDDYDVDYAEADYDDAEYEDYDAGYRAARQPMAGERTMPGVERKPRPHPRMRHRNTVVVDIDDEDPAFEQLDQPGPPVYRRAVGE